MTETVTIKPWKELARLAESSSPSDLDELPASDVALAMLRVWLKEIAVGLLNGFVLGLLIGLVAFLWQGNAYLGIVVGVALCLNTMIAVSICGIVPLVSIRFGVNPAVASGPILTTVTDMCGVLLVLGLPR